MTTRRRFISILAGAAVLPAIGARAATPTQWRGVVLGAQAQIILDHPDADRLIAGALDEIHRLEAIFSLHDANSQLSRLNRDGALLQPAFDFIELLSISSRLNAQTGGAFDPTVQALWSLYAEQVSAGRVPTDAQVTRALDVTGWNHVRFSPQEISFDHAGVMLTLNGIAQGFIADKVSGYFRANGVQDVLVNTGEIAALGTAPDGGDWRIDLKRGNGVALSNKAIATSAPLGTTFDQGGTIGHILDPRTGYPAGHWLEISVISEFAAEADGLSTAFCLMEDDEIQAARGLTEVIYRF